MNLLSPSGSGKWAQLCTEVARAVRGRVCGRNGIDPLPPSLAWTEDRRAVAPEAGGQAPKAPCPPAALLSLGGSVGRQFGRPVWERPLASPLSSLH